MMEDMFQVSFTKYKNWLREMILCGHTQNSVKCLKSNFSRHLVNIVLLTPDFWTLCLLVNFPPNIVDGDSICVLCFRKAHM